MFSEHIRRVVDNVDGGVAGLLMGLDGIAVDSYVKDGQNFDVNTMGMEFSFILTQIKKAAEMLRLGGIKEVSFKSDALIFVVRMLNDEYFFAVVVRGDGNFGKARFLMRLAESRMAAEL